ncbi:MAG: hypothetical protein WD005_02180, partial [Haliea sp.]
SMRRKNVNLTAEADIQRIFQYIHQDNPTGAVYCYEAALGTVLPLAGSYTPKRARDALPEPKLGEIGKNQKPKRLPLSKQALFADGILGNLEVADAGETATPRRPIYVGEDRPWYGTTSPAVWSRFNADRKVRHLSRLLLRGFAR